VALAIGPCILGAPIVVALFVLAIPVWLAALALVAALWIVTWPVERLCALIGIRALGGASARLGRVLRTLSRPQRWLDLPAEKRGEGKR
jgi:hypothetical protein